MKSLTCNKKIRALSRRELLETMGAGFGGLALSALLAEQDAVASSENHGESETPLPLVSPRVKRVIMLFMFGGPSHIDSFDPKPRLTRDDGKPLPFDPPRAAMEHSTFSLRLGTSIPGLTNGSIKNNTTDERLSSFKQIPLILPLSTNNN